MAEAPACACAKRTDPNAEDAAVDNARIDFAHAIAIDVEFCLHVETKLLDDDVGLFGEAAEPKSGGKLIGRIEAKFNRPKPAVVVQAAMQAEGGRPARPLRVDDLIRSCIDIRKHSLRVCGDWRTSSGFALMRPQFGALMWRSGKVGFVFRRIGCR